MSVYVCVVHIYLCVCVHVCYIRDVYGMSYVYRSLVIYRPITIIYLSLDNPMDADRFETLSSCTGSMCNLQSES